MDLLTRLRRLLRRLRGMCLGRMRLVSIVITSAGLLYKILEAPRPSSWSWPPSLVDIFSWVGVAAIFMGIIGLFISFEKDKESFTETLRAYMVPDQFAKLPIAKTPFANAMRDLVGYCVRQHEGGYLPTYTDMEVTITIEVVNKDKMAEYKIPKAPPGYSWLWFHFTIERTWFIKPIVEGHEVFFDPQKYFVDKVIVMSYPTYLELYNFTNPRQIIFYPIPSRVFEEEPLKRALASGRYLSLKFQVTKWWSEEAESDTQVTKRPGPGRAVSDTVELKIKSHFLDKLRDSEKEEAIKSTFPGIESYYHTFLREACKGTYEIHKVQFDDNLYIYPHESSNTSWKCHGVYDLILPAKVIKDGEPLPLWDQQVFELVFERVATVKKIVFQKAADSRLTLREDRRPVLLCFPRLQDPTNVKVTLTNDKWEIEDSSGKFWYPGDTVLFYWHDTLISLLPAQSSK
jgi:hypothetical protein